MSKEKWRVPKLRFPGFTEDWEQRELAELCNVYDGTHQTPRYTNSGVMFVSVENIKTLESDKYISEDDFKNEFKIFPEFGDILLTRIGDVGSANIILDNIKRAYYVSLALLKPKGVNSLFLLALLSSASVQSEIWKRTLHIAFPKKINKNEISKVIVSKPSILEQKKIGELIYALDQIITLHQHKLDNLKLKKKALLQKLFPKNGERYPELRFPGFTDAWEQRKLTDIAKTFIGLVTTMTENYRDSGTLLIRNSDIKEGQFIFSEKPIHLDEEFAEKNKTRRLQIGDVVTVHTGEIGTSAVIKEKEAGAIGFATINTRTDKRILNPYFLSTYFNTDKHKCYANSVSTGDGRSNYNIKDFNKLVISIPTLDEQEKISAIINNINTIITLHQRKLDHLQLQKKALLQQMFV